MAITDYARGRAWMDACEHVKTLPNEVVRGKPCRAFGIIGPKIGEVIDEFLQTGAIHMLRERIRKRQLHIGMPAPLEEGAGAGGETPDEIHDTP